MLALAAARACAGPRAVVDRSRSTGPTRRSQPPSLDELVLYELHVGTFTPEGTFDAAIAQLAGLAELGVTAIELMPVAEFPGARGWGYDGVYLNAAQSTYGGPEGLRAAGRRRARGRPRRGAGRRLQPRRRLGREGDRGVRPLLHRRYETSWGQAINYDDEHCDPVREWVCQSAEGWVRDFGLDGLRLDAIHAIFDSSPEHIVAERGAARARRRRRARW